MTSLHERTFRKSRWGNFYPRGPKARRYALVGFAAFVVLAVAAIALAQSGHSLAAQIASGVLVAFILVYNGFVSTRSDL